MSARPIREKIHEKLVHNCDSVSNWFGSLTKDLMLPLNASFDVRDSGRMLAPVDANIFPAGFNNI